MLSRTCHYPLCPSVNNGDSFPSLCSRNIYSLPLWTCIFWSISYKQNFLLYRWCHPDQNFILFGKEIVLNKLSTEMPFQPFLTQFNNWISLLIKHQSFKFRTFQYQQWRVCTLYSVTPSLIFPPLTQMFWNFQEKNITLPLPWPLKQIDTLLNCT